jgi:hypothetical protein
MIPFVMMTDNRGQRISVNPEIVQFVRTARDKRVRVLG